MAADAVLFFMGGSGSIEIPKPALTQPMIASNIRNSINLPEDFDVFFDFFKINIELDGIDDVFVFRFQDIDDRNFNAAHRLSVFVVIKN